MLGQNTAGAGREFHKGFWWTERNTGKILTKIDQTNIFDPHAC